jgi:hypothetical protein
LPEVKVLEVSQLPGFISAIITVFAAVPSVIQLSSFTPLVALKIVHC